MSINNVIDLIETKLKEDAEWGNAVLWGNLDSFQNDYDNADLPVTCCFCDMSDMIESSTQSDHTTWNFSIKGVFYLGEKITTKTQFKEYTRLRGIISNIYNNVIDDLGCAWLAEPLDVKFESIDERFSLLANFSITVETIRN